ncbi:hypothetical protein [Sulfurimonas sp.]|jgi:hypothetical protein|uniref:hypothetical protein n=1 Tax=Sulfurimonas sp. TaxID=2022749 RepID=UPI0025F6C9A3|nr:hypothetical protein [Sulfurimonas sp.]MBT5935464.1 hypothetical protein [Sulfurimonas sp.]
MSDKSELLDELDTIFITKRKLNFNYFLYIFLILSFITMFSFPKVYITQQIYFQSRDISKLKREYETLKEENKIITASVEAIRFKNQILDTLF